jgi:hypothetical protein
MTRPSQRHRLLETVHLHNHITVSNPGNMHRYLLDLSTALLGNWVPLASGHTDLVALSTLSRLEPESINSYINRIFPRTPSNIDPLTSLMSIQQDIIFGDCGWLDISFWRLDFGQL